MRSTEKHFVLSLSILSRNMECILLCFSLSAVLQTELLKLETWLIRHTSIALDLGDFINYVIPYNLTNLLIHFAFQFLPWEWIWLRFIHWNPGMCPRLLFPAPADRLVRPQGKATVVTLRSHWSHSSASLHVKPNQFFVYDEYGYEAREKIHYESIATLRLGKALWHYNLHLL